MNEPIERLREYAEWARANEWEVPICLADDLEAAVDKLTADVAPVRHGRWVNTHPDSEFVQCSLCKYPVYAAWNVTSYCPNCGCRMDGG